VFIEDEATKKQKAKCRHDFYQVGSTISLSVYAKKTDPDQCTFKASSHQLSLEIGYEGGAKAYSLDAKLFGPIDPTKCAFHDSRSGRGEEHICLTALNPCLRVLFCVCSQGRHYGTEGGVVAGQGRRHKLGKVG
jgi:hypothetical protein